MVLKFPLINIINLLTIVYEHSLYSSLPEPTTSREPRVEKTRYAKLKRQRAQPLFEAVERAVSGSQRRDGGPQRKP